MEEVGARILLGGAHRDRRGFVQFVNDFEPKCADRFYVLHPVQVGEVRGWVGHRRETKWFFAVTGEFEIGVVAADVWPKPSASLPVTRYALSSERPAVLHVPPGHFTAIIARAPGSALTVFSTGRIEAAAEDDFRLPPDYWPMAEKR